MTPERIVEVARTFLGTPWHHAGRLKGVGIDCCGLVAEVYRECGFEVIDQLQYSQGDEFELLIRQLELHCNSFVGSLQGGDVLVFRSRAMDNHCAIANGEGGMIHSYSSPTAYRVVEHPIDENWINRLVAVYRNREVQWQH